MMIIKYIEFYLFSRPIGFIYFSQTTEFNPPSSLSYFS
jgi:hypothetical protein